MTPSYNTAYELYVTNVGSVPAKAPDSLLAEGSKSLCAGRWMEEKTRVMVQVYNTAVPESTLNSGGGRAFSVKAIGL